MNTVRCGNCGLIVQVPPGGRRLCGCGKWLAADVESVETAEVPEADLAAVERLTGACRRLLAECGKVIVGQQEVLEQVLLAILARGHCLLVGVPGLAKTLMIRTLADALNLTFSRIQFTPDLMPSDITGTEVMQEDRSDRPAGVSSSCTARSSPTSFWPTKSTARRRRRRRPCSKRCRNGRSPSAARGTSLPEPFFVLATQNPIEQEGTYPLPEAQLDRFMFNIRVDYPDEEEEFRDRASDDRRCTPGDRASPVGRRHLEMQDIVRKVPVAPTSSAMR